jgi:hypothetical protein
MGRMEGENIHEKIKELLGLLPDKLAIVEEQIPLEVQMAYFELSKKFKGNFDSEIVLNNSGILFIPETLLQDKKEILAKLASIDKPEAYRIIEKYLTISDNEIHDWAKLALLENRMSLESSLLEQNQVLISSGLGGKNNKLRYFLVVFNKEQLGFSETRKKVVNNEFDSILKKQHCEIEEVDFFKDYFTMIALIPLETSIRNLFSNSIFECNHYGNFLKENFIITNVKKLSHVEIHNFILRQNTNDNAEQYS